MRKTLVDGDIASNRGGDGRPDRPIAAIKLIGGHPALDFVNTVDWRGRATPVDYLVDFTALIEWMGHAGLLGASESRALRRRAAAVPARAAALLRAVVALREAAHCLFRAGAVGTPGRRDDLAIVN